MIRKNIFPMMCIHPECTNIDVVAVTAVGVAGTNAYRAMYKFA
jgi:hypothetical protein